MEEYLEKQKGIARYGPAKWREIEENRRSAAVSLELLDKKGRPFWFVLTPVILALISEIERNRGFLASLKLPKKFLDRLASEKEKKKPITQAVLKVSSPLWKRPCFTLIGLPKRIMAMRASK